MKNKKSNIEVQIEELESEQKNIRRNIYELKEIQDKKVLLPILRKNVGNCFVYNNGYNAVDRWNIYLQIVSLDESESKPQFKLFQFQKTFDNKYILQEDIHDYKDIHWYISSDDYIQISKKMFNKERKNFFKQIQNLIEE